MSVMALAEQAGLPDLVTEHVKITAPPIVSTGTNPAGIVLQHLHHQRSTPRHQAAHQGANLLTRGEPCRHKTVNTGIRLAVDA
jgi:hypothetical protein